MTIPDDAFQNCLILLMGLPGVGKQTVGKALARQTNFRLVDHHGYYDVFLKLFGDDGSVMETLDEQAWDQLTAMENLILATIAEVCPKKNNYVITQMMFDQDPYHQAFYEEVLTVANKRQAVFIPIRLVCEKDELARRVQSESRKQYFKTTDPKVSYQRSREKQVFYSKNPNEMTIDNTHKTPDEVVNLIIHHVRDCQP